MSAADRTAADDITVTLHRYSFRGGYYATATAPDGRYVCTGVYCGPGGKARAAAAARHELRTGTPSPDDAGCPG